MLAQQPKNSVRAVLPPRYGRVFRTLLGLDNRDLDLRFGQLQVIFRIVLSTLNFLARELARGDRVHALDAMRHVAVGDALHLEHMQVTELGDLVECERRIFNEPHGGGFGHQRCARHESDLSAFCSLV